MQKIAPYFLLDHTFDPIIKVGVESISQKYAPMNATITLPNGKEIELVKGQDGVEKIFPSDQGELVVVYAERVVKFGNYPYVITQPRKATAEAQVE